MYRHSFSREELKTISFPAFLPCPHDPPLPPSLMVLQQLHTPHSLQVLQGRTIPPTLGSPASQFTAEPYLPQMYVIDFCETVPQVLMLIHSCKVCNSKLIQLKTMVLWKYPTGRCVFQHCLNPSSRDICCFFST